MNHNEYWIKRNVLADKQMYRQVDNYFKVLEREFLKARAKMDEKIYLYLGRIATNNNVSLNDAKKLLNNKELAGFHLSLEEYIRIGSSGNLDEDTIQMLKNASGAVRISRLQALQTELDAVASTLWGDVLERGVDLKAKVTSEGYARMISDLEKIGKNVRIASRLNKEYLDHILHDPWGSAGKSFSEAVWDNRNKLVTHLNSELVANAMGVQSLDQAAENITKAMNTSFGNAKRLVHTEAAAGRSSGRKAMYERLGAKEYEIVATLDGRTSDICIDLDNKVFKTEHYEVGVTAPPFHPWCRTTTVPRFGNETLEVPRTRAARDDEGKTVQVEYTSYKEWAKANPNVAYQATKSAKKRAKLILSPSIGQDRLDKYKEFLKQSTRKKIAQRILDYEGLNLKAQVRDTKGPFGQCSISFGNGKLAVDKYQLNSKDYRSEPNQLKTIFHELFHAKGHGLEHGIPLDPKRFGAHLTNIWKPLEETFAETTSHYLSSLVGIGDDLIPSYSSILAENLPKLKQIPKFKDCETFLDIGRIGVEYRWGKTPSANWNDLFSELQNVKLDKVDYASKYLGYIKKHKDRMVDRFLEVNPPYLVQYRSTMLDDLEAGIKSVENGTYPNNSNEKMLFDAAFVNAMKEVGLK